MFTIGYLWLLIVLAVAVVFALWYWTVRVSHRSIERISEENPKLYNFSFRVKERRKQKRE
jgi:hypothetical protein